MCSAHVEWHLELCVRSSHFLVLLKSPISSFLSCSFPGTAHHSASQSQTLDQKAQGPGASSSAGKTVLPASQHLPVSRAPGVRPDSGQARPQAHPWRSTSGKQAWRPPHWQLGLMEHGPGADPQTPPPKSFPPPLFSHTRAWSLYSHRLWGLWWLSLRLLLAAQRTMASPTS